MDEDEQWRADHDYNWGEHPAYNAYLLDFQVERAAKWAEFVEDIENDRTDPMTYSEWLVDEDDPQPYLEWMDEYYADLRDDRAEGIAEDIRLGVI